MTETQPIRVIIADDHDIMREGLLLLLEDEKDIQIIDVARNGDEVVEKALQLRPDIILMDISMPGLSGIEATKIITKKAPEINIIMLTMHEDGAFFLESLEVGVTGYFLKGEDSRDLVRILQIVNEGGTYLSPKLAGGLVQEYLNSKQKR